MATATVSPVLLRSVAPSDKSALLEAFTRLSPESRYLRFLSHRDALSDEELRYLTEVDHDSHEALVAVWHDRILGVARYIRKPEPPDVAEFAVVVADDCRRKRLAAALLAELSQRARASGIRVLEGIAVPHNHAALQLVRGVGATVGQHGGSTVKVRLSLATRMDGPVPLPHGVVVERSHPPNLGSRPEPT